MTTNQTPWPSSYQYAMAHPCPTRKAKPGEPCDAPRKTAAVAARSALRARFGYEPIDNPADALHLTRHAAGRRHYERDVRRAPWPEDRELGKRYDTLPREAA